MQDIKAYRPETNSICSGQVLQCPYSFEKARLVVREMAEAVALDLLEKKLVTDQLTLTVGYDIENTAGGSYHGEIVTDRYGRKIPKHTHGTANLPRKTSSARSITDAVLDVYDTKVNPKLSIRRLTITANRLVGEDTVQQEPEAPVDEEEETESLPIRRMAIPVWSAAQIAESAKNQGDAPDIVKDDITKVTLFDYSDIVAGAKPASAEKQN